METSTRSPVGGGNPVDKGADSLGGMLLSHAVQLSTSTDSAMRTSQIITGHEGRTSSAQDGARLANIVEPASTPVPADPELPPAGTLATAALAVVESAANCIFFCSSAQCVRSLTPLSPRKEEFPPSLLQRQARRLRLDGVAP
jgi:hypothetical protein